MIFAIPMFLYAVSNAAHNAISMTECNHLLVNQQNTPPPVFFVA